MTGSYLRSAPGTDEIGSGASAQRVLRHAELQKGVMAHNTEKAMINYTRRLETLKKFPSGMTS